MSGRDHIPGIRVLLIPEETFDRIVALAGGMGGLGAWLNARSQVPDLKLRGVDPDGIRWRVHVESTTFTERERCPCRAPEWKTHGIAELN